MLKVRPTRTAHAVVAGITVATVAIAGWTIHAQQYGKGQAVNNLPNPYMTIDNYFTLPGDRKFGATSTVDIDKDGKTVWIAERCGANSGCLANPTVDPILHFDEKGKLLGSFGAGLIVSPHGIHVDRDGNIWIADYQDNAPAAGRGGAGADGARGAARGAGAGAAAGGRGAGGRGAADAGAAGGRGAPAAADAPAGAAAGRGAGGARGAAPADAPGGQQAARGAAPATPAPFGPRPGATKGHQVWKFSPQGKVLLTLGKAGGAAPPECCYQPNDVITNANGDIFVSEGHGNGTGLILKFDKTGKFIKQIGKPGSGPGEFSIPHALAFDSRGRLFVADRGNVRLQILDQEGKFLEEWYQFSRLSGIYIDKNDVLYGADSESTPASNPTPEGSPAWIKGIRIGSAKDGKVQYFIPDPELRLNPTGTSAAEGVAADAAGNIYGAEVGPMKVHKYVRK